VLPEAALSHYRAQQRLTVATLSLTKSAWGRVQFEDLDASWARVSPLMVSIVSRAQLGAARNGLVMVPAALAQQGQSVPAEAAVDATAFAGWASDGRSLDSLLVGAKIRAKEQQSLEAGLSWLQMVAHTMVADASRQAAQVDMFTRPRIGYVRAVNAPCCQRCAVLAGKFSRSDVAFQRHPKCDCINVPTQEGATHPGVVIGPGDIKDLTKAQRAAIDDGADMNQVINSHRAGARSKNGLTTTEGATRRGVAGKALGAGRGKRAARLTPEGIYRIASDRDEALRLLQANGYLL